MVVMIELLNKEHEQELFEFELNNRLFFETMVPGRGEDFYIRENFKRRLQELLEEQMHGISQFYVIKDQENSLVGRINLVDVDWENRLGHVGYRIGQNSIGKGIATHALGLLLKEAVTKNVSEIHAKTTNNNAASLRVLEKMNFRKIGVEKGATMINGEKLDFIHYMWTGEDHI